MLSINPELQWQIACARGIYRFVQGPLRSRQGFWEHKYGAQATPIMPWVEIKTGFKTPDGHDEVLREYFCDHPGCQNVATQMLGCIVELRVIAMVCDEHAIRPPV